MSCADGAVGPEGVDPYNITWLFAHMHQVKRILIKKSDLVTIQKCADLLEPLRNHAFVQLVVGAFAEGVLGMEQVAASSMKSNELIRL